MGAAGLDREAAGLDREAADLDREAAGLDREAVRILKANRGRPEQGVTNLDKLVAVLLEQELVLLPLGLLYL